MATLDYRTAVAVLALDYGTRTAAFTLDYGTAPAAFFLDYGTATAIQWLDYGTRSEALTLDYGTSSFTLDYGTRPASLTLNYGTAALPVRAKLTSKVVADCTRLRVTYLRVPGKVLALTATLPDGTELVVTAPSTTGLIVQWDVTLPRALVVQLIVSDAQAASPLATDYQLINCPVLKALAHFYKYGGVPDAPAASYELYAQLSIALFEEGKYAEADQWCQLLTDLIPCGC